MSQTITWNRPLDEVRHLMSDRPQRRRKDTEDERDIRESLRAIADTERTNIDDLRRELGFQTDIAQQLAEYRGGNPRIEP